jgi:hypothetical protein
MTDVTASVVYENQNVLAEGRTAAGYMFDLVKLNTDGTTQVVASSGSEFATASLTFTRPEPGSYKVTGRLQDNTGETVGVPAESAPFVLEAAPAGPGAAFVPATITVTF